jgi:diguanylate cyclase (GGDEF)-like protein
MLLPGVLDRTQHRVANEQPGPVRRAFASVTRALPRGGTLPEEEWARRHGALLALMWVSVGATAIYSFAAGHFSPVHISAHIIGVTSFALLAGRPRFSRTMRSAFCSLGLLTAAAALVHISGGIIEMHFAFFVFIVALTLYEDWLPFLLAVAYVLLHHGIVGMIDPKSVFNSPNEWAHPWKWAAIHAGFVAMAGAAAIVAWRLNENVRTRMREAQDALHHMAVTDVLTGLANRRQLITDLNEVIEGGAGGSLTLFDLNGFKAYNDTFGHLAGDSMLVRLGTRLMTDVGDAGRVYRLGGDEFCAIVMDDVDDPLAVRAAAADALSEAGKGFTVTASQGTAVLPTEASTSSDALRLADRRMYAQKAMRTGSASSQTRDVLVSALAERLPDLEGHLDGVARLADAVGRELGLDDETLSRLGHAARLHDIGKVAIPDAILLKAGPLTDDEWGFMRTHTLLGERILAAAPALSDVVHVVRASHEWFDGRGYPDGLIGEDIPLEARIILVCDSFDAMTSDRPYRERRSDAAALAELRGCSGTQFDPAVVSAFEAALARRASGAVLAAR